MSNQEKINENKENEQTNHELEQLGAERSRAIHENLESKQERSHESAENLKAEAMEKALSKEKGASPSNDERLSSPAERRTGPIGKVQREASYHAVMKETRAHMSAPSRAFSKVIHNKAVEKASEVAASTVARPNAILSGAFFAFVLTLGVYVVAKNIGYPLSGFETIGAFILGWLLGLAYDFLKIMITGRK